MQEVYEHLMACKEHPKLFHGSPGFHRILEPRQADDLDKSKAINNQCAVYAAADPTLPIVKAMLVAATEGDYYVSLSQGFRKLIVETRNAKFVPGYVHVLDWGNFETISDDKEDYEIVCYEKVKPLEIIRVEPSILDFLDVEIREH